VLAIGVPFATVFYWLVTGTSAGMGLERLLPALLGSLSYSLSGGLLTTLLAIPLVLASLRLRGVLIELADRLPYAIHGLPGLVIALALIFFSIRYVPDLYQSPLLVVLAYVMLYLPLAQSSIRASAELVPPELENVARSLGRSPLAAFAEVTLTQSHAWHWCQSCSCGAAIDAGVDGNPFARPLRCGNAGYRILVIYQ
jgi:iron(III) transport system permease protein